MHTIACRKLSGHSYHGCHPEPECIRDADEKANHKLRCLNLVCPPALLDDGAKLLQLAFRAK